jgi:predicted transcriptional regulator
MATASTTSLKLDVEMKERVQKLAAARRRSSHWIMREAIEEYVSREEKREQFLRDGIASYERYKATGLHVTGEEMDAWMEKLEAGEDAEPPACHL